MRKLEENPEEASPGAVAEVLDEPEVTPQMLKRRELLRRLDVVGLRLGEAADALADGAVKHSQ